MIFEKQVYFSKKMMFSNFVTFTEVVKLSRNVYYQQREVNFSEKIILLILDRLDIDTFENTYKLINNEYHFKELATLFIDNNENDEIKKRFISCMLNIFFKRPDIDLSFFGNASFSLCCIQNRLEEAQYLSNFNIDIHYKKDTPLILACNYGNLEIVEWLLENDADVHTTEDLPILVAIKNGHSNVFNYLLNTYSNFDIKRMILTASIVGNLELIKYFVESGEDIHFEDDVILAHIPKSKNLDLFKYCVEQGCRILNHQILLPYCVGNRLLDFAKYLIEEGVDVNFDSGFALKIATQNNYLEMIKYLIDDCKAETHWLNGIIFPNINDEVIEYLQSKGVEILEGQILV